MPDFNQLTPPASITDPGNARAAGPEYPRHLHKCVGEHVKGDPIPTDKVLIGSTLHEYIVVSSEAEKETALAAGFSLGPVLEAPELPKARKRGSAE